MMEIKLFRNLKEYIFRTIDSAGAGDAFLAGLVVSQAWGANLSEAAYIGKLCAGVS
jgi:sugar/nucleoside kinase (ribokinase family)